MPALICVGSSSVLGNIVMDRMVNVMLPVVITLLTVLR
jgi:hypothetical protein